ncbi:hypothetical protein AAE478_001232 [Parahypoxylon ruwenzoriense]
MEPIAVTGFAFELPQGAGDEPSFWDMLEKGKNAMTEWPASRAHIGAFYQPGSTERNTLSSKGGHFLKQDPAAFDAPFFSITSKEAMSMDPQQRWLLEISYRALENAGMPLEKVMGTETGVFSGSMTDDWSRIIAKDPDEAPANTATGSSLSLLANRLSWYFDFKGPSVQVNTACSSSMVAMDLACQSLRTGQSSMALVTGSNLIMSPETSLYLSNMMFLSPDSLCYSFDHRANGYSRGEGVIVLVLKRLSSAVQDGDMIRAVIRATGSNQDGYTPGITQPNPSSQEELIRAVYKSCNLGFGLTRYVEAHGTGTQIGDSTELNALGRVFKSSRSTKEPLYIGSVKANIGHLEGGSGLAGILKAIMILEKGVIPPNPLFEKWNPKIKAKSNNFQVPTACIPWPTKGLRRVSVNSFGFGGSNGHIVIDDAYHTLQTLGLSGIHHTLVPSLSLQFVKNGTTTNGHMTNGKSMTRAWQNGDSNQDTTHSSTSKTAVFIAGISTSVSTLDERQQSGSNLSPRKKLLIWSAKDESALHRVFEQYGTYFETHISGSQECLNQLAHTLATRRNIMTWRSFSVVDAEATNTIASLASLNCVRSSQDTGIAFIFTGQGAQYVEMGLELRHYPIFQDTMAKAATVFRELGAEWSLVLETEEMQLGENINLPALSQPLCTALQLSLVELLRSFNIVPEAVVGHSSGEIAAAYAIGALSFESACKVAYHRGRLAQKLTASIPKPGAMLSVNLPEGNVHAYLENVSLGSELHIACINSSSNVTLAGDEAAIDTLKKYLDVDGIFAQKLRTGVAYHTPAMHQIASEYLSCLGFLEQRPSWDDNILMISSVSGERISRGTVSYAQYWVDNLVSPVRFADALQYLAHAAPKVDGLRAISNYVEVGPHGALRRYVNDTLGQFVTKKAMMYTSVLSKFDSPLKTVLETVGRLFARGYPVSIVAANQQSDHALPFLVDTPAYPFNHTQIYWYESRLSREWRLRGAAPRSLLGTRAIDWNPLEPRWRKMLSMEDVPWIADHVVNGVVFFPATGTLMMALEAVKQMAQGHQTVSGFNIKEATFMSPIVVRPEEKTEVLIYMRPLQQAYEKASVRSEVRIFTFVDGYWNECFKALIHTEYEEAPTEVDGSYEALATAQALAHSYEEAKHACDKAVSKHDFYKWHHDQGLQYGEAFSLAEQIFWDGDELGVAQINTESTVPFDGVVHPAVFDASCQVCFTAPSHGMLKTLPTIIPHKIREAWVSAAGWQYPDTRQIRIFTKSKLKAVTPGLESSFTLLADDNSPLCHIKYFEMLPVVSNKSNNESGRKIFHSIDSKPHLPMLTTDQLKNYCSAESLAEDESDTIDYRTKLEDTLRTVVQHKITQLQGIDTSKAPVHMKTYVSWLERQLQRLPRKIRNEVSEEDLAAELEALKKRRPSWRLFVEIAECLSSIVGGEVDASELFYHTPLSQDFFDDFSRSVCGRQLESYLQLSVHHIPSQRVLEVGAGAGGLTRCALSIFQQIEARTGGLCFSEYVYTDISAASLEKARGQFAEHQDRMTFKSLDLEKDITTQGFEPGTFDTIFAGNVLYATKDLNASIRNLQRVLKPGGHLILHEVTAPDCFVMGFGFGILADWWHNDDKPRAWKATITEPEWDMVLKKNGFTGSDLVIKDYMDDAAHYASIIISTAKHPLQSTAEGTKVLLIVDDKDEYQKNVAFSCMMGAFKDPDYTPNILSISQLDEAEILPTDYVVFLADVGKPLLADVSEATFGGIQRMVQRAENVLWVTSSGVLEHSGRVAASPYSGLKDGFLRTLRSEFASKRIVSLSIESEVQSAPRGIHDYVAQVFQSGFGPASQEVEYVVRDGMVCTGRLIEESSLNEMLDSLTTPRAKTAPWLPGPPLKMGIGSAGSLETLRFVEDHDAATELGPTDVEIETKAWGVNFREVFIALGRIEEDDFGTDCAGVVTRVGSRCTLVRPGDRVCMFVLGCFRTYARSDEGSVVRIPNSVSFEKACAVVSPAITAWHSLVEVARLQRGEKVLIHAASGATGQLAVQIAQLVGAEVFATVGYDHKKRLLAETYGIPNDHILYSRNSSFAKGIMRLTGGYGVDVVLNSLVGEGLRASWECIAPYGRFVEIGKADIIANSALPMAYFARNVSFCAVDLRHILLYQRQLGMKLLHKVMELAGNGSIRFPSPLQIYKISEVEKAFRYLQSGKNSGRIVIAIDRSVEVQKHLTYHKPWTFDPNASYLVAGGLGGIGRSILRWMSRKGAKYLIVPTKSGIVSKAAAETVDEITHQGVHIETPKCDVSVADALTRMVEKYTSSMPPIRGCINAAMILNDSIFDNMTHTQWEQTIMSKVNTSWNLHALLPKDLDFFVLLSSISGVIGNPGQANYAAGCTFQDALAQFRVRNRLNATSVDLGVVRAVGVIAESGALHKKFAGLRSFPRIEEDEIFAILDACCDPEKSLSSTAESHIIMGVATPADLLSRGLESPDLLQRPLFSFFGQARGAAQGQGSVSDSNVAALFQQAETEEEKANVVVEGLARKLARALLIQPEDVDSDQPLHAFGVDSLVAVELKNWIEKEFGAKVAVFELMGGRSVAAIGEFIAKASNRM